MLKWLGDNGRFLVSTRITRADLRPPRDAGDKGKLPSPYNEEFVQDILEMGRVHLRDDTFARQRAIRQGSQPSEEGGEPRR